MHRILSSVSILALTALPAAAQDVMDLDMITVFANQTDTPLSRTGTSVDIIDEDEIADTPSASLSSVISRTPGVTFTQPDGPAGLSYSGANYVRLRGLDQKYAPVLLNGIDISDPSATQTSFDWKNTLLGGISRVEVVKGSQSALYGSEAVAGVIATADADRARRIEGQLSNDLYAPGDWTVRLGDSDYRVEIEEDAILVDGEAMALEMEYTPGEPLVEATLDGTDLTLQLQATRTGYAITTRGAKHTVRILQTRIAHLADHMIEKIPPDLSKMLICPMPGLLVKLHVGQGEEVQPGQPLATVEAMKMENILRAEKAGTIAKINASEGESLAVDEVILELE